MRAGPPIESSIITSLSELRAIEQQRIADERAAVERKRAAEDEARRAAAAFRTLFPQLADVDFEYVWGGYVDISLNRAPHWGRLGDNVYFAQGFSGHGVATTGLAGRVIAEAIRGQSERLDVYERIAHRPFPGGRAFRMPLLVMAMGWYKLRDALW